MDKQNLLKIINQKKDAMVRLAGSKGLTDRQTVKCSQELDYLILKFQKL